MITMTDLEVSMVRLDPMRVASVRVEGEAPEVEALARLRSWAEPKGLLQDSRTHPVFGFNNPSPTPDKREYGYEFWIRVDPGVESDAEVKVKNFDGGLFAHTTCKLSGDPHGSVVEVWHKLVEWVEQSRYKWRSTHELEGLRDPFASEADVVLDLYLPVEE
jgi:AraC family transcriptional regulator